MTSPDFCTRFRGSEWPLEDTRRDRSIVNVTVHHSAKGITKQDLPEIEPGDTEGISHQPFPARLSSYSDILWGVGLASSDGRKKLKFLNYCCGDLKESHLPCLKVSWYH